ncbi:MAG: glutamate--tRNA ligase family protein [Candidatus Shikimatogenerans bostrichidophilus]|nr:MAG: glutamate--tRNA ligase family protein [Candidatus Shikimatogenerans bostrichidophilus]
MNNFIIKEIINDINKGLPIDKLKFRFAPEPNGVLHLGHVKAIYINFYLAKYFNSKIYLRLDDTNPNSENIYFVKNIIKNIKWLGYEYSRITYTSDYFGILYNMAKNMIKNGKAFIETKYGKKIDDIDKNLFYFKYMKLGHYKDNDFVLRAYTDKSLPNYHIKNPVMYRIRHKKHYRTANKWYIYPTYDWAHGQSDYIEKISHSLCSIEFQNHRPLYNWFINNIYNKEYNFYKPKQIEFSRLNINNIITSKRYFNLLLRKKIIKSFNDPRLITLDSFKMKNYNPEYIIDFIKINGFTKRNTNIELEKFESYIKNRIIKITKIIMAIKNPIKVILKNFSKTKNNTINIDNKYKISISKVIYIDKEDFKIKHNNNFFRLSFKNYVRLKYYYAIKAYKIKKYKNKITKIYCKIYKNINKNRIRSTIQWVSFKNKKSTYIYDYKYLYIKNNKIYNNKDIKIKKFYIDKNIYYNLKLKKNYQFLRIGFFNYFKKNSFLKLFNMKKKY